MKENSSKKDRKCKKQEILKGEYPLPRGLWLQGEICASIVGYKYKNFLKISDGNNGIKEINKIVFNIGDKEFILYENSKNK